MKDKEQIILNNLKPSIESVDKEIGSILNNNTITEKNDNSTNNNASMSQSFSRVRYDDSSPVRESFTQYNDNNNFDNTKNGTAAFAFVLGILEIVSLIFLVALITFVALHGLS